MQLALRNVDHAIDLLLEYNRGKRTRAEEMRLLEDAGAGAVQEWDRLGFDRYYQESELLKYELLRWHLRTKRWALDFELMTRFRRPGTVLDFGAGIGLSAFTYAAHGFVVTAVEASLESDTVRFGRFLAEKLGIIGVTFTDRIPEGPFDHITAIETFEHFPDWTGWARSLVAVLAPGGILCATFTFESGSAHPEHPYHFESPVEPLSFLRSLGLELVQPHTWRKTS